MFSLVSFVFLTALVGLVSWLKTRKDDHAHGAGYFLAGNSLTGWVVAGSLMLTNLSTEQIVGLNGGAYLNGAMVMAWEVVAAIALVVMALYFLPRYWAGRITTVPQFIERRFGRGMRQILSVLFLFFITIQFLPFVLYSGALVINSLFGVPELLGLSDETSIWVTVWAVGTIGSIYAVFGGLRAVAISDTVNGIGLLIGGFLVPVLGLMALGGGNPLDGWERILENQSGMLDPIGAAGSNIPVGTLFTGMLLTNVYYWCTNQQIVQRTFGAKSLAEGQKGVLIAAVLKLLGPLYLVLPGIIALEMFGSDLALPDTAYPRLVEAVLPAYLAGFFGAVLFGAILSSYNSALHSASTLFGLDVYKTIFRPEASDEETVRAGKIFGGVLAVAAMCLAPLIVHAPEGLFTLMKKVGAVINIPILAVVVMGVMTRRTHARAARIGLFSGMIFYVVFSWVMGNRIGGVEIHWLHSVGLNFVFMCGLMALLSRLIPAGEAGDGEVLLPAGKGWWRLAKPMSALLIVLVFTLYVLLHHLGG